MPLLRPWSALSPNEQELVAHIISVLREFNYGRMRMDEASLSSKRGSTQYRFYLNALYTYVNNFFLVTGAPLSRAMKRVGLEDLLVPSFEVLDRRLGGTDLRHILRVFRDKFLVHSQFSFDPIERAVYKDFAMSDPQNAELFSQTMSELMHQVDELHGQIIDRFPGIEREMFVDGGQ